jgi:hypothetical protein
MMNPQEQLLALIPEKKFFIGIDSDGCAFDTSRKNVSALIL